MNEGINTRIKRNRVFTPFRKWFIAKMFSKPYVISTIMIGTTVLIVARGLFPIIIGDALDKAIMDNKDLLSNEGQLALLSELAVSLVGIAIIRLLVGYVTTLAQQELATGTQKQIREEFFDSIQKKPLKFHDSTSTGEIMALATNDIGQIGGFLGFGFGMVTEVIINLFVVATLVIGVLNSVELLITSIPFLIAYIWTIRDYNKKMGPISQTFMRKWSGISRAIQDNIAGAEVVRAFQSEQYERKKFKDYIINFRDTWEKRQIIQAKYYPTLVIFSALGFTFLVSCYLVVENKLTIGGLFAFNGLIIGLLPSTYIIAFGIMTFNAGLAGAGRIHKAMFTQKGEVLNGTKDTVQFSENASGDIRFENVSFKYPTSKKNVLENINLHIAPFQTVAIVGPTGSGKSSLVKLLLRLYDYQGSIKIDDIDIRDYDLESLRKGVGMIEQDIYLFPRTIKENISYGKRDATDNEIEQAAKQAQIHDWIMSTPKKYGTSAGEGGSQLSGGQKQRVALARTFLANPRILILDDSTSSVDSRTEEEIIRAIEKVATMRTTFIITHRLSLIRKADVVLVIKDGGIVAQGRHEVLITTSTDYRRIFGKNADLPPLKTSKKPVGAIGG